MAMILLWVALVSAFAAAQSTFGPARPPAIPLAVRSPYLSSESWSLNHQFSSISNSVQHGKLQVATAVMEDTSPANGRAFGRMLLSISSLDA